MQVTRHFIVQKQLASLFQLNFWIGEAELCERRLIRSVPMSFTRRGEGSSETDMPSDWLPYSKPRSHHLATMHRSASLTPVGPDAELGKLLVPSACAVVIECRMASRTHDRPKRQALALGQALSRLRQEQPDQPMA